MNEHTTCPLCGQETRVINGTCQNIGCEPHFEFVDEYEACIAERQSSIDALAQRRARYLAGGDA